MEERRKLERFSLSLPAKLETPEGSLLLYTSNVSSDGAFFPTVKPLPAGTSVRISLALSSPQSKSLGDITSLVEITGKVCRSEHGGMAVVFDSRYKIIAETIV